MAKKKYELPSEAELAKFMDSPADRFTPYPAEGYEDCFAGVPYRFGPEDGRLQLTLASMDYFGAWRSESWTVIETRELGAVEVRSADCGGGCRCAAEIRPVGGRR